MKFKYEVVVLGSNPTFNSDAIETFLNPVAVGHKIKKSGSGQELLLVDSIEHYNNISVIYVKAS